MAKEYEWTPTSAEGGTQTRMAGSVRIVRWPNGEAAYRQLELDNHGFDDAHTFRCASLTANTPNGDAEADAIAAWMQAHVAFTEAIVRGKVLAPPVPVSIAHTATVQPTGDFLGDIDRMLAR